MEKQRIREIISNKRSNISLDDLISKSVLIKEFLFSCNYFIETKNVMFYASYCKEVETWTMIKELLKEKKKDIFLPKIINHSIKPIEIRSIDEITCNKYGIPEPIKNTSYKGNIDLIIVPGVAFDRRGYRIGSGRGYYDKFLEKNKAKKIALAFDIQIVDFIPQRNYDVPVNSIVTDRGIINCCK